MTGEPRDAVVSYPGGLRVRYRWAGSGRASEVFALTEAGGTLLDLGPEVAADPDSLCRAELRVESPVARWTARLASTIWDEPAGVAWDTPGLFVVKYGFHTWAFAARTGELRWRHRSGSPVMKILGSSRIDHVLICAEVETFAVDAAGDVVWRLGHSDVVAEAELVGGRLVLTSYGGLITALDPASGMPSDRLPDG